MSVKTLVWASVALLFAYAVKIVVKRFSTDRGICQTIVHYVTTFFDETMMNRIKEMTWVSLVVRTNTSMQSLLVVDREGCRNSRDSILEQLKPVKQVKRQNLTVVLALVTLYHHITTRLGWALHWALDWELDWPSEPLEESLLVFSLRHKQASKLCSRQTNSAAAFVFVKVSINCN